MATAAELLAGELIVDDAWFEVDLLARRINIPKSITNLGAKSESDVTHVKFKLPRFLNDIDFADFEIGIDYTNAQGEEDRYEPKDVTINEDIVTFTWVVGRHAALYQGNVTFGLCAKRQNPSDPDNPLNEFHTTKASLPILDAMETCEEAVIEHTDLLEQWRRELFGAGNTIESEIRAVGAEVLATIPEDYQATVRAFRSKADAITSTSRGEIITVSDSSDDPIRGLKIFGKTTQVTTTGKNLLDVKNYTLGSCRYINGVLTAAVDNYYYCSCKTDALNELFLASLGETFTLSCDDCPSDKFLSVVIFGTRTGGGGHQETNGFTGYNTVTFTISTDFETIEYVEFRWNRSYTPFTDTTTTVNELQLEVGSVVTSYEPYTGGIPSPNPDYPQELMSATNPEVTIHGKNMFDPRTCKIYNDRGEYPSLGTTTVSGNNIILTKTSQASYFYGQYINVEVGQTYTISFNGGANSAGDTHAIYIYADKPFGNVLTTLASGVRASKTFVTTTEKIFVGLYACGSTTTSERLIYSEVQLERSDAATDFIPGTAEQTLTIHRYIPGIPVSSGGNYTDSNGRQWICDEIDFERGVYIKRIESVVLNGIENWSVSEGYDGYHRYVISDSKKFYGQISYINGVNTHFYQRTKENHGGYEYLYFQRSTSGGNIYIQSTKFTTVDELKTWLSSNKVTALYVATTPIETPLTAEELANYRALHSNFPNTVVINDSGAAMELKYNADTTTFLRNCGKPTDEQVQTAVDTWLSANYVAAEGVSF